MGRAAWDQLRYAAKQGRGDERGSTMTWGQTTHICPAGSSKNYDTISNRNPREDWPSQSAPQMGCSRAVMFVRFVDCRRRAVHVLTALISAYHGVTRTSEDEYFLQTDQTKVLWIARCDVPIEVSGSAGTTIAGQSHIPNAKSRSVNT